MEQILSYEMWPTVSYCCMSSFHRKGMNWRHLLTMKIVCIFLNWESSLRLHRVVLLHITWEGKYTFFFVPITTFYQTGQYASPAVVPKAGGDGGGALQWVLPLQLSAKADEGIFGGKSFPFLWQPPWGSFCLAVVIVPPHRQSPTAHEKGKAERKTLRASCCLVVMLRGLWKPSTQQMQKDRAHAAQELFFCRARNPGIQQFVATCHLTHIFKVAPSLGGSPSQTRLRFPLWSCAKRFWARRLQSQLFFSRSLSRPLVPATCPRTLLRGQHQGTVFLLKPVLHPMLQPLSNSDLREPLVY